MHPFKVGDKVRYIGNAAYAPGEWCDVKRGSVLTIYATESQYDRPGYLRFEELLSKWPHHNRDATAFERADSAGMLLSEDPATRKNTPITTGVLDYFPLALAAVAQCSKAGNDQHNPGQPLHWAKEKSTDHADCIARHLIDRDSIDTDGIAHAAKLAWRALAFLQIKLEEQQKQGK